MKKLNKQAVMRFLEKAWDNLLWDGMEIILYKDGDSGVRQQGSFGKDEEEIAYTLSLDTSYWIDSYAVKKDEDGGMVADEDMKEDFMEEIKVELTEIFDI